jgi:signal peptidase I
LNDAGLGPNQLVDPETMRSALHLARRGLVLVSAIAVAFLISGGIFTFTPLVGIRIAHTSGISMEPAYKEGDVVLIKDTSQKELHVGDIVVFNALGQQFMHRIIEKRVGPGGELFVVTQGDNVAKPDFPVRASQVSGKLVGEIPLLGSLSRLIDADGGFYVYRSMVLTLAVSAVAIWGLTASARRRVEPLPVEAEAEPVEEAEPADPEA